MPKLKGLAPLAVAAGLWATPFVPSGCASSDIESNPDFRRGVAILQESEQLFEGGLTPDEVAKFERLSAEFRAAADRLQAKFDADEAVVHQGAEAAKPFIPAPFGALVDPLAMGAIYLFMRGKHKSAFADLVKQMADLSARVPKG